MALFGGNRSVKVGLSVDPKGVGAGLSTASKQLGDWAKAADQSLAKHRKSWEDIGGAATKAGLVIGVGAAAAVVKFAQFDQAMSRAAAGTGATKQQMDQLRKAAIDAGRDTQYSATEAADAITAMGKAGVGVQDILGGGLQGALSLAASGELEVGNAAEIAATAMTQFGLHGKDLPHVADLLAAGAGKAQGSVSDLAGALKYVGPVAHGLNIPLEQTVGVLAELASQGILSEQAGTSMRGLLLSLTPSSVKAANAMKSLGLEFYDANGKFVGLEAVAGQLHDRLGGLTEAQRTAALSTIFGNEQITAAQVLYKGGAQAVQEWTKKVDDAGFAQRQAGQLMDNLAGDVEQLKGSLETALISSGSGANAGLRQLTQGATDAVNVFTDLPPAVQQGTVVVAGLTAGALLLTGGIIKGTLAVKTMRTNLAELGVTAETTNRALGLIGKTTAALTVLSFLPDLNQKVDQATGAVSGDLSKMQLDLANFAKGAALSGEAAKTFGANLKGGLGSGLTSTQSLRDAVNDLSGANGFWNKPLPFLGTQESEQINQMSQALAGLAQSGHAATAAQAFDRLTKSAGLNEDETKRLLTLMPEYGGYLSDVAAQQVAAGQATAGTADATSVLQQQMGEAAYKAQGLAEKLGDVRKAAKDLNDAFLSKRSTARDYQQALDDAQALLDGRGNAAKKIAEAQKDLRTARTPSQRRSAERALEEARKQAKDTAVSLDITTEAGRKFQAALDGIASSGQAQADAIAKAGGSDAEFRASLTKSREDLVKYAEKFGLPAQKAKELADQLLRIPEKVSTDVEVNGITDALRNLGTLVDVMATVNGKRAVVQVASEAANLRESRSTAAPAGARIASASSLQDTVATRGRAAAIRRRVAGGPVLAGMPYWVGEHGSERFVPGTDGVILPHQATTPAVHVVQVPVASTHRRESNVNFTGPVIVRANDPGKFTDWATKQHAFGSGGVG